MNKIDRSKMRIKKRGFRFRPFRPSVKHEKSLQAAQLTNDVELLAFERGGERRVLLVEEMHYHHIAQGELAGGPYMVSF